MVELNEQTSNHLFDILAGWEADLQGVSEMVGLDEGPSPSG